MKILSILTAYAILFITLFLGVSFFLQKHYVYQLDIFRINQTRAFALNTECIFEGTSTPTITSPEFITLPEIPLQRRFTVSIDDLLKTLQKDDYAAFEKSFLIELVSEDDSVQDVIFNVSDEKTRYRTSVIDSWYAQGALSNVPLTISHEGTVFNAMLEKVAGTFDCRFIYDVDELPSASYFDVFFAE